MYSATESFRLWHRTDFQQDAAEERQEEKREEKEKAGGKTRQLTGKNNTIPYSSNKECGMISMLKLFGN